MSIITTFFTSLSKVFSMIPAGQSWYPVNGAEAGMTEWRPKVSSARAGHCCHINKWEIPLLVVSSGHTQAGGSSARWRSLRVPGRVSCGIVGVPRQGLLTSHFVEGTEVNTVLCSSSG